MHEAGEVFAQTGVVRVQLCGHYVRSLQVQSVHVNEEYELDIIC